MALLWIVPPSVLILGAIASSRLLAQVGRRGIELRLAMGRMHELRTATESLRTATARTRRSFDRLGQR